jgi:hypothetical protein
MALQPLRQTAWDREGRLHLRFARGHEYLVGFPATSVCRSCRTVNEFADRSVTTTISPPQATSR